MVLSGPPTPGGGVQSVPPSLMRSNSGILGAQGGSSVPSQPAFPSLLSPRGQYNNMSLLSNISNVSSLLNQSFGSGGSNAGITGSGGGLQCGGMDVGGAESDPRSSVSNGMSFTPSATALVSPNTGNPSSAAQPQGQQFAKGSSCHRGPDQPQLKQLDAQNFQHGQQSLQQFPAPHNQPQQQQSHQQYQSLQGGLSNLAAVKLEPQIGNEQNGPQQQQSHQQYQSLQGGLSSLAAVKLEPQIGNEQNGPQQQQQPIQSLRNLGSVKMEAPHMQSLRSLGQVKMEPPHSEHSLYLQHQQQQQQLMQMSRQTSPAAAAAAQMTLLQQQRLLQLQQQQQQILKAIPQQRSQFQQQNLSSRPAVKSVVYEPGMGARRLTSYMYTQQHRPPDNNIEFWRKFVAEYFAPNARKRWCVSLYGSGRQTTGVFPQDVWHCKICNRKPGRGFETTVEVLPRLFKIKYDSGTMEELLYVDMPQEYQNPAGQIVLDYAKAIQESVFEQLRVVRDGQLRIVFTSDLKICSWEFCARRHEELIPRRLIIPQVSQLGTVAQKYQAAAQNASSNLSSQELHNTCDMFVASARQLAKALDVPLVNDLGYTKRYVRCLQISEVVNSMKDLIDYSRQTGTGPMASLINFPRRTATSSGHHNQGQQSDDHQMVQNSNNNQDSIAASNNGVANVNNALNAASTPSSAGTIVGLLQNSMNSRQEHTMINANGLYGSGNSVQIPSASSSSAPTHPNPPSPFQSPSASASNNPPQTSHNALLSSSTQLNSANSPANIPVQQRSQSNEADPNDFHCSVQQIIQDMMMSSQLNAGGSMIGMGSLGTEMKNINGMAQTGSTTLNGGGAGLVGNGVSTGISSTGFSSMGGLCPSSAGGIRRAMVNNSAALSGRVNMSSLGQDTSMNPQQQDLGTRLLSGLGAVDNFNSLQFDWKSSP